MIFKVEPCYKKRNYHQKHSSSLFLSFVSSLAILSCSNSTQNTPQIPLAGKPAYGPSVYSIEEFNLKVGKLFKNELSMEMKHDIPLKLTENGKTIEFTADGYNENYKIAYEWVGNPETVGLTNEGEILSSDEIQLIKNMKFSSTYIVIFSSRFDGIIHDEFADFYEFYKTSTIKK